MFFQDATPDTSGYMILGYAIFFIVTAIYLVSFYIRTRNLQQDMSMLENIKSETKAIKNKEALSKVTAGKVTAGQPAKTKKSKPKASSPKTKKKK